MRSAERRRARGLLLIGAVLAAFAAPAWPKTPRPATRVAAVRAAAVDAFEVEPGAPVRIELERFAQTTGGAGYFTGTLRIDNRSAEPLTWRVNLSGVGTSPWERRNRYEGAPIVADFLVDVGEFAVPANSTREFPLHVPVPGSVQQWTTRGPFIARETVHVASWEVTGPLVSSALWVLRGEALETRRGVVFTRHTPADFSTQWQDYQRFPAVLLQRSDWLELSAAQRAALRDYVLHGGTLQFDRPESGEVNWLPEEFGVTAEPGANDQRFGHGWLRHGEYPAAGEFRPNQSRPPEDLTWISSRPPWLTRALPRLPLHLVIGGSALLAGPVTFLWLARRRGRHWVFVALPGIALGATALLLICILWNDGTGGHGRRLVIAALDESRPLMVVKQIQAARCGWLFAQNFSVPPETALSFAALPGTAGNLSLQRRGGDCSGDWFRNRTATAHALLADVPTRAALGLRLVDGKPTVVSTFPAPLERLLVRQGNAIWYAARVEPGRATALERLSPSTQSAEFAAFGNPMLPENFAREYLGAEDRFLARTAKLEGAPIETLRAMTWEDTLLVSGRCTAP